MTLNQLEYFQKIAQLQHFRHAAEVLNISQPSLSRSMSALEQELNLPLFDRQGRNIILTKSGKVFLEHVNRILDEVHMAEYKMKQLSGSGGHIDIAYVAPLTNVYIPRTVRSFLDIAGNEQVTFHFNQLNTSEMISGLKSGRHDVIFGSFVPNEPDIEFVPILKQYLVVIVPPDHPLAKEESISIQELNHYPLIVYDRYSGLGGFTTRLFREHNIKPNIVCECTNELGIASLVTEHFGIALVANVDEVKSKPVIPLKLNDVELVHPVYMGYIRSKYQIPAVKRFIHFIESMGETV